MIATPPAEVTVVAKPALRFALLESASPEIAGAVAEMHVRLLPTSPVVLLGKRFLRDFYYTLLPAHGFIHVTVAYVDDKPAGFIAVAPDPNGFMGAALRRWWYRIAWLLFLSVAEQPSRLAALWEAFRIMSSRKGETPDPFTGEFLSLGVLPEYTDPKFVHQTGLRIARELITRGVQLLADSGAKKVLAVVDADNLPARMMYFGLGWKLSEIKPAGWRTETVAFIWETQPKP